MDWTHIFSMVGFETVSTQNSKHNLQKPNNAKYILVEACLTSKLAIMYLDYKTFFNRLGKYVILGLNWGLLCVYDLSEAIDTYTFYHLDYK